MKYKSGPLMFLKNPIGRLLCSNFFLEQEQKAKRRGSTVTRRPYISHIENIRKHMATISLKLLAIIYI